MSVQSEINRISGAKSDIGAAIAEKGVTVPAGTKIDAMAALIRTITGGGSSGDGSHEQCIPYEGNGFTYTVGAVEGAQYGFALQRDGFYESQNKGHNSSYALCRISLTVQGTCDVEFKVINNAENNYDYGMFGVLDTPFNKNADAESNVKKSYKTEHSANEVSLVYENVPAGDHFIDVKYIKDNSQNKNNDSLQFKVVRRTAVTIAPEYYPIISATGPVINALEAIENKGVSTAGAGFGDLSTLIAAIEAGGGGGDIVYGIYTPTENTLNTTIVHGFGEMPGFAMCVAMDIQSNLNNTIYACGGITNVSYFRFGRMTSDQIVLNARKTALTDELDATNPCWIGGLNANSMNIGTAENAQAKFYLAAGVRYLWLVMP